MPATPRPRFFRSAAEFRAWLETHHDSAAELWMGYWKKASGKGGLTYRDALDEALCFGWIDGVVRSIDDARYMQRWTPRKPTSHWSLVNVRRVGELEAAGRMHAPGRAAFARRTPERTGQASFESPEKEFSAEQLAALRRNKAAWAHFSKQPAGYRRIVKHWVTTAKREETRARRLALLISSHAKGERIPQLQ